MSALSRLQHAVRTTRRLGVWAVAWSLAASGLAVETARKKFDLPADIAARSLKSFAHQSGVEVLISAELGREIRTQPVRGEFTPREALDRMLAKTGLTVKHDEKTGSMAIFAAHRTNESPPATPEPSASAKKKTPNQAAPEPMKHTKNAIALLGSWLAIGLLPGQVVDPGATATQKSEEALVLSPFVVSSDKDVGYLAANTLSGSRLNTPLVDTPASISEMTKDFLDDIGANNTMDAVAYALGFEADRPGANDNLSQFSSQTAVARGVGRSGTVSRDFFPWNLSSDTFGVERLSLSRGPNSILFGLGNAGGIINSTSKRASFRTRSELNLRVDDNGSWRVHLDHNRKLTETLALRVNLLKDDMRTWRELEYTRSDRIQVAGTWRPFTRTEVRANYERGVQDRLAGLRFSARDAFTNWIDAGSPAYDRTVNGNTYPVSTVSLGANQRLSFDSDTLRWVNWQRFATTTGKNDNTNNGLKLQDETYVPFTALLNGRASTTNNAYWTGSLFVQQELAKNLYLELAVNKQSSNRETNRAMQHAQMTVRVDPNRTLPGGATNPNFGKFYIEGQALQNAREDSSVTPRATLTYQWDTRNKWFGRHQWLGLFTQEDEKGMGRQWNEANLTPISPAPPAVTNAQNTIWRRTYLNFQGGNRGYNHDPFRNAQAPAAFSDPVNGLNGTITPGFFLSSENPTTSKSSARMIAGQSNFWSNRLSVTYGFRHDSTDRRNSLLSRDPVTQIVTGSVFNPTETYAGNTRTQGAVFHVTQWFSVYGNRSDNFSPQAGVDVNGQTIGNVKGDGRDYGVKFRWADNKLYARAGFYESSVKGQVGRNFNLLTQIQNVWLALEGATGPHAALFTGSPLLNTDTQDFDVDGYEFEVTANPLKGLSFTANYATLKGRAASLYPITKAHVAQNRALWLQNGATPLLTGTGTVASTVALMDANLGQDRLQDGREGTGNYRKSFNFFGRYQFQAESLKGVSIGAGSRFRAGRVLGFDAAGQSIRAPKTFLADANLAYGRKIWNKRVDMRLQLNVQNLFDNHDLIWASIDPTTYVKNDYTLFTPRLFTLSGSFSY
ncbi:MAG: hypothetical protein JNK23_03950 [Opitutaceae bacterium]|nr:hypothetical protein [Opitutaceae bacterium]